MIFKNVGAHLHCIPRATYSLFFCKFKHHAGHPIYNQCHIIVDGFVRLFTQVGAKFKDLFSVGTITPDGKGCVEKDFRLTKAGGLDAECLKVKKGFEAIASRLEKRRYAAYLGCTTEFRKWEVRTRFNFTSFSIFFFAWCPWSFASGRFVRDSISHRFPFFFCSIVLHRECNHLVSNGHIPIYFWSEIRTRFQLESLTT